MAKLSERQFEQAKRWRDKGWTLREIADKYGVTREAMSFRFINEKKRQAVKTRVRRYGVVSSANERAVEGDLALNGFTSIVNRYHEAKAFVQKFEGAMKGLES